MKKIIQFQTDSVKSRYPIYFKVANYFRNRRFHYFRNLFPLNPAVKILDVGGTYEFWKELSEFQDVTLLNVMKTKADERIKSIIYSGGQMPFEDKEYEIIFSNSTIEHVGDFWDQKKFAEEVIRCGNKYFVQVPSFWFPYEPHAHIPFFQFLPAQ